MVVSMKRVELWDVEGLCGIIIECKSGIIWNNQAGGTACAQPEVEGIFVPLSPYRLVNLVDAWPGLRRHIDEALEDAGIDDAFEAREYDGQCGEAWVPVAVKDCERTRELLGAFIGMPGFLVYQNSD